MQKNLTPHAAKSKRPPQAPLKKPLQRHKPKTLLQLVFQESPLNYFLALSYLAILVAVLFAPSPLFDAPRWQAVADLNRDGLFTITDLFLWCFWLFYVPGDVVVSVLLQFEGPTRFFELYSESYGGLGSLTLSGLYWWLTGGMRLLLFWLTPIVIQSFLRQG